MYMINSIVEDKNPVFNSLVDCRDGVDVRTFTKVNLRTIVRQGESIVFFQSHDNLEQAKNVHRQIAEALHNGTL